jgi:inner membrane protein
MTAPTHITFAEFLYLLLLTTTGVALNAANALLMAVASLLPDIDTGGSTVGKLFPSISLRIERRFGHRTLTHSVIFLVPFALATLPLAFARVDLYACLLAGYISHPLLDTVNVNGVKLFYPFSSVRCVFPMDVNNPHRFRVQTGSRLDRALGVIFLLGCIPTFYIAQQGYERFIRVTQQNMEAAVRDYNEFSRDHLVLATVDAYDMLTRHELKGTFEVVGALNPNTLVFKAADGHLHTLGKEFMADYVAGTVVCRKDRPAFATVRTVDMSNQILAQLSALVDTSMQNYFFGDISTIDKVSLPENIRMFTTITGTGGTITLNFATLSDIRDLNLEYAFVTKGILTIKSISANLSADGLGQTDHALPRYETYAQLSYLIEPSDSVEFFKARGDTIRKGDLIARKILPAFYQEQQALNDEKLQNLQNETRSALEDLEQKITNAALEARADSSDYRHRLELVKAGFVSPASIAASELKWRKGRRLLRQFESAQGVLAKRTALEIDRLRLLDMQLKARARAARLESEIRSPMTGVLMEIRQLPHDNKSRLILIIKRLLPRL